LNKYVEGFEETAKEKGIDHAAAAFVQACDRRAEAEQLLISILSLSRSLDPNDVARTRTDAARREVLALIEGGGERAPELRIAEPVSR